MRRGLAIGRASTWPRALHVSQTGKTKFEVVECSLESYAALVRQQNEWVAEVALQTEIAKLPYRVELRRQSWRALIVFYFSVRRFDFVWHP